MYEKEQNRDIYWAMLDLSDREKQVIEYHYSICFADFEQGAPEPTIQELIKNSHTLEKTAQRFGISEKRVNQIINKFLRPWYEAAKRRRRARLIRKYYK